MRYLQDEPQQQLQMLKLPNIKINNQLPHNPSITCLKESIATTTSNQQNNSVHLASNQRSQYFYGKFSSVASVQGHSQGVQDSPKNHYLKTAHLDKIRECVMELGVLVSYYRSIEKDEVCCKKNLFYWFHQSEKIFLNSLRSQLPIENPKINKKPLQLKNPIIELSNQMKTLPIRRQKIPQKASQVNSLKAQVEQYKKNNSEYVERIEEIYELLQGLKEKFQNEKMRNQELDIAISAYVHQTDYFLQKLGKKNQKEQSLTPIQREIQQAIIKLKFKTSDYHFKK